MLRIALVVALLLAGGAAYAQFNRCAPGFCPGGIMGKAFPDGGGGVPQPTGKLAMTDGVSLVLQTDGVSRICLAGGC